MYYFRTKAKIFRQSTPSLLFNITCAHVVMSGHWFYDDNHDT
eukprot:UN26956